MLWSQFRIGGFGASTASSDPCGENSLCVLSLPDDLLATGRHLDIGGTDKHSIDSDDSLNIASATARLLTMLPDIGIARPPTLSAIAGELAVVDLGAEP